MFALTRAAPIASPQIGLGFDHHFGFGFPYEHGHHSSYVHESHHSQDFGTPFHHYGSYIQAPVYAQPGKEKQNHTHTNGKQFFKLYRTCMDNKFINNLKILLSRIREQKKKVLQSEMLRSLFEFFLTFLEHSVTFHHDCIYEMFFIFPHPLAIFAHNSVLSIFLIHFHYFSYFSDCLSIYRILRLKVMCSEYITNERFPPHFCCCS